MTEKLTIQQQIGFTSWHGTVA